MKSRNILILALIMALVTTFFFAKYLRDLDKKYKMNDNRISVVVPKQDIKKNQKVTKDMLEIKDLPTDSVHPEAVKKIEEIEGSYALTDIKQGEILFLSRFTNQFKETELVTRKIRAGLRAVSIEVNFVESVSNLIEPEDYVDVVFSERPNGANSAVSTQIMLENVRVLAVGKRLSAKEAPNTSQDPKENTGKDVEYIAVTLELKPADAARLINCDERGSIKLILRGNVAP
jgi:pilus assembly protein CpaB